MAVSPRREEDKNLQEKAEARREPPDQSTYHQRQVNELFGLCPSSSLWSLWFLSLEVDDPFGRLALFKTLQTIAPGHGGKGWG
mmetsp:Transcript_12814/g.35858  ORF Transcript_12814/g.35858 Transcript_12814/m.35858 type:complete len:83 (-) Transcript_12814:74-322(-)